MSLRAGRPLSIASNRLLVGDASKILIAAPAAGYFIRVFSILATCVTAGAQQIDVGVNGGGVLQQIMSIPSGATAPTDFWSDAGFSLPPATALSAVPAAAAPAWQFIIEYTVEQVLV